jgi:DNA-binding NarL/FixJ family response regulator
MTTTTIALADDHDEFRKGLHDFLTNHKYQVLYDASQGKDLIKLLRNGERLPDICILDLEMNNQNGIETAKEIHQLWPHIKIILFSMAYIPMLEKDLLTIGISKYLYKGRNPQGLIDAIKELINEDVAIP